jgi:predicted amidophosphoribosyltransferase
LVLRTGRYLQNIFFILKTLRFTVEGLLDRFFDGFSVRICFSCKKKKADFNNGFFCENCFSELGLDFTDTQKELFFNEAELSFLFGDQEFTYPKIFYVYNYDEKTKFFIREFKYRRPYYDFFCAAIVLDYFLKYNDLLIADLTAEFSTNAVFEVSPKPLKIWVSYMPMYKTKLHKRGFNQARLIAKAFSRELSFYLIKQKLFTLYQARSGLVKAEIKEIEFLEDFFIRTKNTGSLYEKNRQERIQIMSESISINYNSQIFLDSEHEHVFLVLDDIVTTGASFISCHRAFLNFGLGGFDIRYLALAGRS